MSDQKAWLVYLITNKINGKVYVGQTSNSLQTRWRAHCAESKRRTRKLYTAIRKYGCKSFEIQMIHGPNLSHKEAGELEIKEIRERQSTNANFGYNHSIGGESSAIGCKWTPASCERARKAHLGKRHSSEVRARISASLMGHTYLCSPQTSDKIRIALTGKKRSVEFCNALRKARIGKKLGLSTISKIREARTGTTHSAETKAKISASLKIKMHSPDVILKMRLARQGKKHSPEIIAKIRLAALNRESLKRGIKTI